MMPKGCRDLKRRFWKRHVAACAGSGPEAVSIGIPAEDGIAAQVAAL